jgi:hypothetical protein
MKGQFKDEISSALTRLNIVRIDVFVVYNMYIVETGLMLELRVPVPLQPREQVP